MKLKKNSLLLTSVNFLSLTRLYYLHHQDVIYKVIESRLGWLHLVVDVSKSRVGKKLPI